MRGTASMRDRLIWGATISLGMAVTSPLSAPSANASQCCYAPPQCCYDRPEVVIAPAPAVSEEATWYLSDIDPEYVLNRVLIPLIYAILILRIVWLIQR